MKVWVDAAEPPQLVRLLQDQGIYVIQERLKSKGIAAGDIAHPPIWGIERKTASDFYGSMVNRGLWSEAQRLVLAYDTPILAIVGNLFRLKVTRPNKWPWVLSTIREMIFCYGIRVVPFPDDEDLARWILSALKHEDEINKFVTTNITREITDKNVPVQEMMLRAIPGIGPEIAAKIYAKYTIWDLLMLYMEGGDLTGIEGIGKEKDQIIQEALCLVSKPSHKCEPTDK